MQSCLLTCSIGVEGISSEFVAGVNFLLMHLVTSLAQLKLTAVQDLSNSCSGVFDMRHKFMSLNVMKRPRLHQFVTLVKGCFNTPLEHTPKPLPKG